MASGLTAEGLIVQRLNDILVSQRQKAVDLFQSVVPLGDTVDTSANTTIGRLISLAAPATADLWEAIQQVDSAFDPEKATGIALDKIVKYGSLSRQQETSATCSALFKGAKDTLITKGSIVSATSDNSSWLTPKLITLTNTSCSGVTVDVGTVSNSTVYTITYTKVGGVGVINYTSDASATRAEILSGLKAQVTLFDHPQITADYDESGNLYLEKVNKYSLGSFVVTPNLLVVGVSAVGTLVSELTGDIVQSVGDIANISTPILGWDSVYNFTVSSGGTHRETDDELRTRFRDTKYTTAVNTLEAMYSALLSVVGVSEVIIYENDTDAASITVAGETIPVPAHSFMVMVVGGDDVELANLVWKKKPVGIMAYAATSPIEVLDSQGLPHNIGINRPVDLPLYISIELVKNSNYPSDGDTQIKTAIIDYLNSNFGIGEDIIYSRLYTPINSVVGHQVNFLKIGTAPSPTGTSNVVVAYDKIHTIDPANIIITTP